MRTPLSLLARLALVPAAVVLVACEGGAGVPGAPAALTDGGVPVCRDEDGDGFGPGCAAGLDCDDGDPAVTNHCRACREPETGCACDPGTPDETCFVASSRLPDGELECHRGVRFCRDGRWTECHGLVPSPVPPGARGADGRAVASLVSGPTRCNVCSPSCYGTVDTPGPADVTTNGSGVTYDPSAGVTLPPTGLITSLPDTDGDGVPDMWDSAPTNPLVTGHEGGFFHVLPFGGTALDPLPLSVQVRTADVYFLMDTTGSMGGEIANLKATLTSTIIPAIRLTIPDAWFGVGRHDDYPLNPYGSSGWGDRPFNHLQDITDNILLAQAGVDALFTRNGNDWPESQTSALYAVATGDALGTWLAPRTTCPPGRWGYPCFRDGTVPIVVLFTDAPYHNGPNASYDYDVGLFPLGPTPPAVAVSGNSTIATAHNLGVLNGMSYLRTGSTTSLTNNYGGSCGAGSARDAVFTFTLSAPATVLITTRRPETNFDTVLLLLNGSGGVIACNDDVDGTTQSRISRTLAAGTYHVVVDGFNTAQGNYGMLIGDAEVLSPFAPPTWAETVAALNARNIRVIVVESSDGYADARANADALCTATGAISPTGTPLRYSISSAGTGLGTAVVTAIADLANYTRMDVTARANDNPATPGFDERTLVSSIAAISFPPGRCAGITGGTRFEDCLPGTTVNFQVNYTGVVMQTSVPQVFTFTIDVLGDSTAILRTIPVTIVIPPLVPTYPPTGTYFRDFDGLTACDSVAGETPRWRNLTWTVTTPAGTSIGWTVQTANDAALLASAPSVTRTTPPTTTGFNVGNDFTAAGLPPNARFVRVTASLNSDPTRTLVPAVSSFELRWDCVSGE